MFMHFSSVTKHRLVKTITLCIIVVMCISLLFFLVLSRFLQIKTPYDYPNGPKIGNITVDGTIPEPDPSNNSNKKVIHPGIICDGCEKPIIGVRYKCTICNDFNYCEKCEAKFKEKHGHPMLKINNPEMCPISINCSFTSDK